MKKLASLLTAAALSGATDGAVPYFAPRVDIPTLEVSVNVKDHLTFSRVTAYNAVPEQTDGDPSMSSCGPTVPGQIAVSRDLLFDHEGRKHMCGRTGTLVTEDGRRFEGVVINDTMAARFTNTADILMDDYHEAVAFGVQQGYFIFD